MKLKNDYSTQESEQENMIDEFFQEAKRANEERRKELALILGCVINKSEAERFTSLLKTIDFRGTVDVTGWNRASVKTLLQISRDRNNDTTIKYGERYLSPVTLPRDGPLLDSFVDAIFTGEWT
ncbi:MAG: hypothetical protein P1Q69_00505 [Candidatus Thorarchaeota archaeon]|nr:hypothetical protein [Candidatus Thorarchaeota archaeon]